MMKKFEMICTVLLIVSGILWGLVGLFDFDLLGYLMEPNWFVRVVDFFFGIAGIYMAFSWRAKFKKRKG